LLPVGYFFGCAVGGRMPFKRRYDAALSSFYFELACSGVT
jgi:hypothetical protein